MFVYQDTTESPGRALDFYERMFRQLSVQLHTSHTDRA